MMHPRLTFSLLLLVCLGLATPAVAQPTAEPAPGRPGTTAEAAPAPYPSLGQVCFYEAGTYGSYTVTTSGPGCGTTLTYGGITGVWLGDTNVTENCDFAISPPTPGALASVALTAHSCVSGGCETVRFRLDAVDYDVQDADVDQTMPPGGSDVVVLPNGEVEGSPDGGGDGRATVTFNDAVGGVQSINLVHNITSGAPNGTIYLVCVDDLPIPVELLELEVE